MRISLKHVTLLFPVLFVFLFSSTGLNAQPGKAFVVKAGESRFGVPTPFFGVNPNDLFLSSKDTKGSLSAFYYKGVQKIGPSLHLHLFQDEVFYVIGGSYVFQLGTEKLLMEEGDLIFLPRNIPHSWVQVSDTGEMFYFLQPAGMMEEFFLKMTEMGGKASKEEFAKVREECGIRDIGPGLNPTEKHVFSELLSKGYVIRSGMHRQGMEIRKEAFQTCVLKVAARDTGGELSIFEIESHEKKGPPMHVLPNQDEGFYITRGEFLFQCGEEQFRLKKGDMIFLPRAIPHTWVPLTAGGKMLSFCQPSVDLESFYASILAQEGSQTPQYFENKDIQVTGLPIQAE